MQTTDAFFFVCLWMNMELTSASNKKKQEKRTFEFRTNFYISKKEEYIEIDEYFSAEIKNK